MFTALLKKRFLDMPFSLSFELALRIKLFKDKIKNHQETIYRGKIQDPSLPYIFQKEFDIWFRPMAQTARETRQESHSIEVVGYSCRHADS